MNPGHNYDTIIVGGGPGGSTAGAFLAQGGHKVLILEKLKFHRFRIGESLLPFGNDVLKASGAWPKIEAGKFIPKNGAEFYVANGSQSLRFWFKNSLTPAHASTFQVERAKFDEILLRHAAECGCEVRECCAAKSVAADEDGVMVTFADAAGHAHTLRARWLVDASGRETFLAKALHLPRVSLPVPKRVAVYAHYRGVYRNEGDAAGHITIVRLEDGWFWFIPLDAEKTSVGMVRALDDFKRAGNDVEPWLEQTIASSAELSRRMTGATRASDVFTTSDYTYRYDSLATARTLMVGDAGGFIDPIFSSGVFIALKSAELAAQMILRAGDRGLTATECRGYSKKIHRMMDIYFKLIVAFYDNDAFAVFMHPINRFQMIRTIASVLAGNTERNFGLWWRMQLFYTICRLQHRLTLAPRVDYSEHAAPGQPIHL